MSEVTLVKTDAINFKQGNVVHPTYQYQKQTPVQGLGSYQVTTSQGPTVTFQLPSTVMNLSKSFLCFSFFLPAQGTNNFGWINLNGFKFIDSLLVQPMGGPQLANVTYMSQYMDTMSRRNFPLQDMLTWDTPAIYAAGAGSNGTFYEGLSPNNVAAGALPTRLDGTAGVRYTEAKYALSSGTVNTGVYVDVKIPLSQFVDTILAVDHDMWFNGNQLTVQLIFNRLSNIAWLGTSATVPSTGAAAAVAVDAAAAANVCAIINPYIWMAVEQNKEIGKLIMDKCQSREGLSFKIPWLYVQPQSISAGGNNPQVFWNASQGTRVKKNYWTVYPTTPATPNLTYDKSNLAGAKITQFQSFIDSIAIQQQPLVPANGDDYIYQRDRIRRSGVQSLNEFLYNWNYVEDFTAGEKRKLLSNIWPDIPADNLIDGLPLGSQQVQYSIQSTAAVNVTNYFFTVFLREVRIGDGQITVV